jgi:hypothetical protein
MIQKLTKQDLQELFVEYMFYGDGSLRSHIADDFDSVTVVLKYVNFPDKYPEPTPDDIEVTTALLYDLREYYMHLAEDTLAERDYRAHRYDAA